METSPRREGDIQLRPLSAADAPVMRELLVESWPQLAPWMPRREGSWFALDQRRADLQREAAEHATGSAYHFAICATGALVGRIDISNIVRGAWQNATVGYWVATRHCGRGHATSALRRATDFAFQHAGLHRVQAAVIPRNAASIRVVEKAGYRNEGLALRYLRINDAWEDHLILAVTAEEWAAAAADSG